MLMLFLYLSTLPGRLADRAQRDETGSVVEWMILGIMAIVVVVALIPQMSDLASRVVTFIGNQLGV